jgi:hypothetical protein
LSKTIKGLRATILYPILLYSAIVATDLGGGLDRDEAVEHFIRINQLLPRTDVVHALCILGHGTIVWAYQPDPAADQTMVENLRPATFMREDRFDELIPVYGQTGPSDSALYELMQSLLSHLLNSVLAPENIAVHYGQGTKMKVPSTPGATLLPDPRLQSSLDDLCIGHDRSTESAYHQQTAGHDSA